jgi:signal transduction histidine kinase
MTVHMASFFEDIKEYVGFTDEDTRVLREFHAAAAPHFEAFATRFYDAIERHPNASAAITGGQAQIHRLRKTLAEWMSSCLLGPHDEAYYERRARIGRMHVRIDLPQQYMFTAMNLIRVDFARLVETVHADHPALRARLLEALDRIFDLELAIMLRTYQEDSEDRLRRKERLATIGQIAGSIGHELRNPLGVIQSSLFILRKRAGEDPRVGRHITRIDDQVELCNAIISNLLELARSRPPRREPVELQALFDNVVANAGVPPQIEVVRAIQAERYRGDPTLLLQALTNLVRNAVQAYDGAAGRVYLSARDAGGLLVVEVADDGPGFDHETILRVFEPLVSTRTTGVGLGLALVKGVAERHGGTVEAANRPEGGAVVRVRLPHVRDEEVAGSPSA